MCAVKRRGLPVIYKFTVHFVTANASDFV